MLHLSVMSGGQFVYYPTIRVRSMSFEDQSWVILLVPLELIVETHVKYQVDKITRLYG